MILSFKGDAKSSLLGDSAVCDPALILTSSPPENDAHSFTLQVNIDENIHY